MRTVVRLLAFLLLAGKAVAQPFPLPLLAEPDGLPDSRVTALFQDDTGFLWVGTAQGLSRFDGEQFHAVPEVATARILSISQDSGGTLWVVTADHGIYRGAGHSFEPLSTLPAFTGRSAVLQSSQQLLWIGTTDGLVSLRVGSEQPVLSARQLPGETVTALLPTVDGDLLIGTTSRLFRLRAGSPRPQRVPLPAGLASGGVTALHSTQGGALWVGTRGGEVLGPVSASTDLSAAPVVARLSRPVHGLFEQPSGTLWIGTTAGLFRRLPGGDIEQARDWPTFGFYVDRSGTLWAATAVGLGLDAPADSPFELWRYTPDGPTDGLPQGRVTSFAQTTDGALWIGSFGGLSRVDPAAREPRLLATRPGLANITALATGPDDTLWVGTWDGDLFELQTPAGDPRRLHPSGDVASDWNGVVTLTASPSGTLWIGTYGAGLQRYRDRRISPVTALAGLTIRAVAEDPGSGHLWIGTAKSGLLYYDPATDTATQFVTATTPQLVSDEIRSLLIDSAGRLWIGTTAGLSGLSATAQTAGQGSAATSWNDTAATLAHGVWGILEDARGNIWLNTYDSLTRLDPSTRGTTALRPLESLPRASFSDGFHVGSQFRDRTGFFYFGGDHVAVHFDPASLRDSVASLAPRILGITTPTRSVEPPPEGLALSYKETSLTFHFSLLDLRNPRRNLYSYRLEGVDDAWSPFSRQSRVTYSALAPGHYLLRVRAVNSLGIQAPEEAELAFTLPPHPALSSPALALYALCLAALCAYGVRRWLARRRAIARQHEHEISMLTERTVGLVRELDSTQRRLDTSRRLTQIAHHADPVTELEMRTVADERLAEQLRMPAAERSVLALYLVSIDNFRDLNVEHGPEAGDAVLVAVRKILRESLTPTGDLLRWGSHTFFIIQRAADPDLWIEETLARVRKAPIIVVNRDASGSPDAGGRELEERWLGVTCTAALLTHPFLPSDPERYSRTALFHLLEHSLLLAETRGQDHWLWLEATPRTASLPVGRVLRSSHAEFVRLVKHLYLRTRPAATSAPLAFPSRHPES